MWGWLEFFQSENKRSFRKKCWETLKLNPFTATRLAQRYNNLTDADCRPKTPLNRPPCLPPGGIAHKRSLRCDSNQNISSKTQTCVGEPGGSRQQQSSLICHWVVFGEGILSFLIDLNFKQSHQSACVYCSPPPLIPPNYVIKD